MTLKVDMQHRVLEYYQICSNDDSEFDLDLFYGKVKFVPYAFVLEDGENNGFFRNYCSLWYKSWKMQSTK